MENTTNDINSTYSKWFEPHDLEIVVQRQLDGSLIFKAAIIDKDGKKSMTCGLVIWNIYNRFI